ncbi:MAG: hypothetical protein FJ027_24310 [Candidatus Rokubacteria bacterium]|nr:hypothetical protein [Candidatus Rokubacteria bacterium]
MTWTDQIGGSTLSQSTGSLVPGYSTSDANLGGRASVQPDGTDDTLTSNLTASAWNFVHDGTGASVLVVCRATKTSGATNNALATSTGSANRGFRLIHNSTNDRCQFQVSDGATNVISINGGASTAVEPVSLSILVTHTTADTPDATMYHPPGTSRGTGSGTVSVLAAANTLAACGNSSGFFGGSIAEIVFWKRTLTAGEITALAAYTLARYGV